MIHRVDPHRRALVLACCAAAWWCCAGASWAQRIQFPSTVPGAPPPGSAVYPPTPAPVLPALPTYDPYANPALGAPPIDVPYSAAPAPPPSSLINPPPPAYGAPYPTPTYPAPNPAGSGSMFQNMPSARWAQGAGYNYQNPDGTVAHLQRFLQQLSAEHTYLYGNHGEEDLAINRTEFAATFGVPIFYNPNTPLLITPGFAFNWLDGPIDPGVDLPPRVYDAYLDAAWHPQFTPILGADLGVRTGVWTDFHAVNSDSLRVLGRGLGVISLSPRLDVHVGVWYLDRNDVKLLPAGGVHWRPNPEWDAFLIFPNPKVRKRFVNVGTSQWWWYFAGEYGGGAWTVERDPANFPADDDIDINDIRAIAGLEWETQTQARGHIEAGYVFQREIFYREQGITHGLDDTVMVRLGFDF